jgi:opacity protein-like surface antigen
VTSPGVTGSGDIDVKMDMILGEADFTFGVPALHFVAGVRVLDVDQSLSFPVGPSESANTTVADPVLGARGEWPLGETWTFLLRADVGGWGVGSELTYQVLYGAGWKFANQWSLDFGYRLLGYDIKNDDLSMDMVIHGLIAGVGFAF